MANDIKNKSVVIYIDSTAAEQALGKLQKSADGFTKNISVAKEKQQQLVDTIKKLEPLAGNIENAKNQYALLSKEIENNKTKLSENKEQSKLVQRELQLLTESYSKAVEKQAELALKIKEAKLEDKSIVKLQQQYDAVSREIERTTTKIEQQTIAFYRLDASTEKTTTDLKELTVKQKAANEEIKQSKVAASSITQANKQFDTLGKTVENNSESLHKNAEAQKEIQTQIDRGLRPSLNEQKNLVAKLSTELNNLSEDVPEYAAKFEKFRNATDELQRLKEKMNGVEKAQHSWFQEAKGVAFGVLIGNTVQSAVQAIGSYVSGMVSGNAKMSDSLADVEKATGLTTEQVKSLNSELGKIDTRTATADLREIAVGLGQIGEQANKANVQAIDQIVVALGDEFGGGAKEITTTLSVLRNNLQDIKTGDYATDVSHIGNALNVLGAEGLATAPVVTDIANRIAGIGETFKLSSGQILGLAATFQELGIETERGSTAVTKLFQKIGVEPEKFAKVAGVSIKEFKDLVNTDMLGAFQLVAEGAKKAGTNNIVFSQILKELDADGSGAGEVLSKLGTNSELLAKKVNTASAALKNNSSITDEFSKKNNNLAADLEKLEKAISKVFTNSALSSFIGSLVKSLTSILTPTSSATDELTKLKSTVTSLETDTVPLIKRVEELTQKASDLGGTTKLSKDEQVELKKAIASIAETIPSAVTQWDSLGNAIGISTDRAREFITLQQNILKEKNRSQIQDFQKTLDELNAQFQAKQKAVAFAASNDIRSIYSDAYIKSYAKSEAEIIKGQERRGQYILRLKGELSELQSRIQGVQGNIDELTGKKLDDELKAKQEQIDKLNKPTTTTINNTPLSLESPEEKAEREKLLNDVIAFNKKLKDLNFEAQQAVKSDDQKELDAIREKYKKFFEEYDTLAKKIKGSPLKLVLSKEDLTSSENDELNALIAKQNEKRLKEQEEAFKKSAKAEYENQLALTDKNAEQLKVREAERFAKGEIDKRQYEANLAAIDLAGKQQQIQNARDYSAAVEQAAADVTKFEKQELERQVDNHLKSLLKQEADEKLLKEIKQQAANSRATTNAALATPGSRAALDAQNELLKQRREQELAALKEKEDAAMQAGLDATNEFNSQRDDINKKFDQEQDDAHRAYLGGKIEQDLAYAQTALSIYQQFTDQQAKRENAQLARELKVNDAKKAGLKKQLDAKLISQQSYNRQVAALDKQAEQKKEELEKKQFERNKRLQIAQTLINGAAGAVQLYVKPGFPAAIPLAIALGIQTLAAVALIASQKYAEGGQVNHPGNGKINVQRNIPTQPNGDDVLATVKVGEVILNKRQQEALGGADTFSSIGVPGFAGGGRVKPFWVTRSYRSVDFGRVMQSMQVVKFAEGGVVSNTPQTAVAATSATDPALLAAMERQEAINIGIMNSLSNLNNHLANGIEAKVSLKKIDDARSQQQRILNDSQLR